MCTTNLKLRKNINTFSRRLLILLLLIGLTYGNFGCQASVPSEAKSIEITRVISGQTIEGIINDHQYTIRLAGLDTPSFKQKPWGKQAQKFLADTLKNNSSSSISIETDLNKKDKYDRLSGYLWVDQQLINQEIIAQGYAVANLTYTDGQYDQQLLDAQLYARIMGNRIWNPDQPLRQLQPQPSSSSQ